MVSYQESQCGEDEKCEGACFCRSCVELCEFCGLKEQQMLRQKALESPGRNFFRDRLIIYHAHIGLYLGLN